MSCCMPILEEDFWIKFYTALIEHTVQANHERPSDCLPRMDFLTICHVENRAVKAATVDHAATDVTQTDSILRKGNLLEFRKESGTCLLAVVQKPDGKRNWIAADQVGINSFVKEGRYDSFHAIDSRLKFLHVLKQVKGLRRFA